MLAKLHKLEYVNVLPRSGQVWGARSLIAIEHGLHHLGNLKQLQERFMVIFRCSLQRLPVGRPSFTSVDRAPICLLKRKRFSRLKECRWGKYYFIFEMVAIGIMCSSYSTRIVGVGVTKRQLEF